MNGNTHSWHISLYSSLWTFFLSEQGVILSSDDLVKNFLCFLPYYGLTYAFSHELWAFFVHRSNFMLVCVLLRKVFWYNRKLAWDRGYVVKYTYLRKGFHCNKYKSHMMESFPVYITLHFIFFKVPSFSSPKCRFYSILFCSILFYSILFYTILFSISQKLPNKYYFKAWQSNDDVLQNVNIAGLMIYCMYLVHEVGASL